MVALHAPAGILVEKKVFTPEFDESKFALPFELKAVDPTEIDHVQITYDPGED